MTDSQIQSAIACTAGNTPTIRHDGTLLIKVGERGRNDKLRKCGTVGVSTTKLLVRAS